MVEPIEEEANAEDEPDQPEPVSKLQLGGAHAVILRRTEAEVRKLRTECAWRELLFL